MKEVSINVWCDSRVHLIDRVKAEVSRTIRIDNAQPRIIDLCHECDEDLLGPIVSLLDSRGQEVPAEETKPNATKGNQCPLCEHKAPNRQGLSKHATAAHGRGLRDLVREGLLAPAARGES